MPDIKQDVLIDIETRYAAADLRRAEADVVRLGDSVTMTQQRLIDFTSTTQTQYADFSSTTQTQYADFSDTMTTTGRKIAAAVEEPGKVAERSGHWLGRYLQRYLIRYFLVWQIMSKIQSITKDWTQAQQELARAMADVQVATGATDTEMRGYLGTLLEISRVSAVPVVQLATGFRPEQAGTTDLAARITRVTGLGYEQSFALVRQMRREYGLAGDALDRWADEFVAAHARSGMSISEFAGEWQKGVFEYGRGVEDVGSLTRMLDATLESGARSLGDLATAWKNYMGVVQATGEFGGAINQLTSMINTLAELEQKFGLITGVIGESWRAILEFMLPIEEFRWVEEKIAGVTQRFEQLRDVIYSLPTIQIGGWEINFPDKPSAAPATTAIDKHEAWRLQERGGGITGTVYDLPGFQGKRTEAEFTRFDAAIARAEDQLKRAGANLPSDTTLTFLVGEDIKRIETNTAAMAIATSEMNERQKTAVYNMPGNVQGVMIGLGSLSTTKIRPPNAPAPPPYTPLGGGAPYIPGANPSWNWGDIFGYQQGGIVPGPVGQAQPAIVHGGERILAVGESPLQNITLNSNLYLDGKKVARNSSRHLGDMLYQAQRSSYGATGGLVSL